MNERVAPAAKAAMMTPSISVCGVFVMSSRSLNVPGSDSSALHTRYLSIVPAGMNETLRPMAKPAPPRPRTLDASSSSVICCGCIAIALRSDS